MKAAPIIRERAKALRQNMTKAEVRLWARLKGRQLQGWHFRRQHPVGNFITDFACPKARVIVEIDGATHSEDHEIEYDTKRRQELTRQGWTVLRVLNQDVYDNIDGVLRQISEHLPPSVGSADTSPRKWVEDEAVAFETEGKCE